MEEKSRDEVLAERKLRKAAKQAKKKGPTKTQNESQSNDNIELDCSGRAKSDIRKILIPDVKQEDVPRSDSKKSLLPSKTMDSRPATIYKPVIVKEEISTSIKTEKTIEGNNIENNSDGGKSKAELRAERRAKQEAQRALKVHKKTDDKVVEKKEKVSAKVDTKKVPSKVKATGVTKSNDPHKIKLFCHLYRNASVEDQAVSDNPDIHKAIIKLGVQYKNKVIIGSNARVIALLNALKQVLSDHKTPAEKDFSRGFELVLAQSMSYLDNCRSSSVSMINAVKFLKSSLSQLPNNITDHEAQIKLREIIDDYVKEQIDKAGEAICMMVRKKISEDDVILTFGYSSLIERILLESRHVGIKFRVIVVDAGPLYEGKELLRRLVKNKLDCTYVLLSAASYIMKEANKVLLGAHALLTNGYVMSRAGSSQVALIAKSYNVPVLVCCETHKFSERVQTDAFVHNELGDGEKLMKSDKWKNNQYLTPLTLMYDVTPSDLVTAVITELAILPCTSVPVVLRVKPASSTSL